MARPPFTDSFARQMPIPNGGSDVVAAVDRTGQLHLDVMVPLAPEAET